jgi:hypothetical protein
MSLTIACSDGSQGAFRLPTTASAPTAAPDRPYPPAPPIFPGGTVGPVYTPGTGQVVQSGDLVSFTIDAGDAACFENWDMTGRCRLFELTAVVDGWLAVDVTRLASSARDVLDLFVVPTTGDTVFAFDGSDREEALLPVVAGRGYGIFVMGYPAFPQDFTLTVAVR